MFGDLDYVDVTTPTAAGGAGVATGNATSSRIIDGQIVAVQLKYIDSPPVTTDVAVELVDSDAGFANQPIVTKSNSATDITLYPQVQACDTDGVAITGAYAPIVGHGYVKVTMSQANNNDQVLARIWFKRTGLK